jgi:GT2 family glycosyltransferase
MIANKSPQVAIIIPSYKSWPDLERCLASLATSDYAASQVIIVDNNSGLDLESLLKTQTLSWELISLKQNTGYAGACAVGWSRAKELGVAYVFLLNQDALVEPSTLPKLVEYLESQAKAAAAQPLILMDPDRQVINSAGNCVHFLGFGYAEGNGQSLDKAESGWLTGHRQVSYGSGAALLVRVPALAETDLFDKNFFMYHEDLDLGWRLLLRGWETRLVPDARVYHRYEFSRSTKIKYEYGERNRLIVLLQNYHGATLCLIWPAWFVMEMGIIIFSLLNGWLAEKMRGYVYIYKNMPQILANRRRVQKTRTVTDRQALQFFSSRILYQDGPSTVLSILNPILSVYWRVIRSVIFW